MSKKLIELENGLMVEVEAAPQEIEQMSGGDEDLIEKVESSMDTINSILSKVIQPISNTYAALNQDVILEKAEVDIGVGFSAEGNIFIAKGKGSANLNIKLTMTPK